MKKFITLSLATIFAAIGIANAQTTNDYFKDKKVLVLYYSHGGNTKEIANQIKNLTNADIFEIETVDAYPSEHKALTDQAKKEINANYLPPIKAKLNNIADYDVIFVGSPSWWATIAPAVSTFLSEHDLSGKTVIPFVTHGGSYMGNNAEAIAKLAPKANMAEGKAFWGRNVKNAQDEVQEWINDFNKGK